MLHTQSRAVPTGCILPAAGDENTGILHSVCAPVAAIVMPNPLHPSRNIRCGLKMQLDAELPIKSSIRDRSAGWGLNIASTALTMLRTHASSGVFSGVKSVILWTAFSVQVFSFYMSSKKSLWSFVLLKACYLSWISIFLFCHFYN